MKNKKMIFKQLARVGNKTSLTKSISLGKIALPTYGIIDYLDELFKIPYFAKNDILKIPFPNRIESLGSRKFFHSSGDIEKELLWNSYFLRYLQKDLNEFIVMRDNFNKKLLLGKLEESKDMLSKMEQIYGVSYWLLENKIFLLQEIKGIEEHKDYINSINKKEKINPLIKYILNYISIKMEDNVTQEKYNLRISEVLQEQKNAGMSENILAYLKFKLYFKDNIIPNPLPILTFESNLSIYDRYSTFLKVLMCSDMSQVSSRSMNEIEKNLFEINDNFGLRKYHLNNYEFDLLSVIELYTMGDYKQTLVECEKLLNKYPFLIDIYPLYIKSAIRIKEYDFPFDTSSILYRILSSLKNIYLSNDKFDESYSQVKKFTYVFSSNLWSVSLRGMLEELVSSKRSVGDYIHQYKKNVHSNNPLFISDDYINSDDIKEFSNLLECSPNNNTLKVYKAISENDITILDTLPIPNMRKNSKKALILYNLKKFEEAKSIYSTFLDSSDTLYKIEGIIGFVNCCIELSDFKECVTLIVDLFLEENLIVQQLDYKRLLKKIQSDESNSDNIFKYIETPILFDIYSKMFSENTDDTEADKSEAYEEFLLLNGFEKPSEIDWENTEFSIKKLIYFFKYICIESVMDYSTSFNSTEEIEQERILICQKMRLIEVQNKDKYSEEIRYITQKQVINRSIRDIQKSKIYVDVTGIKASLEKETKENLERYKSLLKTKVSDNKASYIKVEESIDEFNGVTIELTMPTDERRQLLNRIIFDIRDSFVSSNKFGLDSYLSVGIRHGTLSGQLRAPLEEKELLTRKDSDTGRYQLANYWKDRNLNSVVKEQIIKSFDHFGKEIDSYIDTLKNKWIQIKTEAETSNAEGLFNFQFYLEELEGIDKKIDQNINYDSIFEIVTNMLWEKTDESLNNIRSKINGDLKEKFNNSFDDLLKEIDSLKEEIDVAEIRDRIVTSKVGMQYELDKVSGWFTRNSNSYSDSYTAEFLIDVVNELTKNINNKEVELIKNIKSMTLHGSTLKSFVDVLFILFDNIVKHSNIENTIPVDIELYEKDKIIYLNCENIVSGDVITPENERKISKYRSNIEKQKDLKYVSREGGTGFYKIHKIINVDLNSGLEMNFGYNKDQSKFFVALKINSGGLIIENINN